MTDDDSATKVEPDDDASTKAQQEEEEVEQAKKQMEEIEEGDPPEKLEDWPGGKAKYQTYGGPDSGEGGYEDGATAKLGPSNLRHHEDGSVTIDGEEVDNPDEYKGEPIPGGPSDDRPGGRRRGLRRLGVQAVTITRAPAARSPNPAAMEAAATRRRSAP